MCVARGLPECISNAAPTGWDVRGAVHKIWAGTRDYKLLRTGVDPGSCDAIKAVLEHTRRYDEQYGHKVYTPQ